MAYYPKYFITTNLYTEGGEYVYRNNSQPYEGPYWKLGNGRTFTGVNPQQLPTFEIVLANTSLVQGLSQYVDEPLYTEKVKLAVEGDAPEVGDGTGPYMGDLVLEYVQLTGKTLSNYPIRILPKYNPVLPSQTDYTLGEFRRFFCKKINENIYIEVDKDTYTQVLKQSPEMMWELYSAFNISWTLTGDKDQVYDSNKNMVEYAQKTRNLTKFGDYLKHDYLKYYK